MQFNTSWFKHRNKEASEILDCQKLKALTSLDNSINEFILVSSFENSQDTRSKNVIEEMADRCILNSALYAGMWIDNDSIDKLNVQTRFVYAVHLGVLRQKNILDAIKDPNRKFSILPDPIHIIELSGDEITVTNKEKEKVTDILFEYTADQFFDNEPHIEDAFNFR